MKDIENTFGFCIRKHREYDGLTLERVCQKLATTGYSWTPSYVSSLENGTKLPSPAFVARFEKVFGIMHAGLWKVAREELVDDFEYRLEKCWARDMALKDRTT